MPKKMERLSEELEERALDMILEGQHLDDVHGVMGFKTRKMFDRYLKTYPDFEDEFNRTKVSMVRYWSEELQFVHKRYPDHNQAKVRLEALKMLLQAYDPDRWIPKQKIEVNNKIDINQVLEAAEKRAIDVTPRNVIPLLKNPNDT